MLETCSIRPRSGLVSDRAGQVVKTKIMGFNFNPACVSTLSIRDNYSILKVCANVHISHRPRPLKYLKSIR